MYYQCTSKPIVVHNGILRRLYALRIRTAGLTRSGLNYEFLPVRKYTDRCCSPPRLDYNHPLKTQTRTPFSLLAGSKSTISLPQRNFLSQYKTKTSIACSACTMEGI